MKLEEVSDIFIGVLKSRFQNKGEFKYSIIDYSSLQDLAVNVNKSISLYTDKEIDKKLFIKKGDIIVKLYPPINFYLVDEEINFNLLPLSNVAIIRKTDNSITYKELIFILKQANQEIEKIVNGSYTNIKTMKLSDLKKIEIKNIINDKKLKTKSKLYWLFEKQKKLLERKKELILLQQKKLIGGSYE